MGLLPLGSSAAVCSDIQDSVTYQGKLVDGRKFGVTLVSSSTTFAAVSGRLYVAPRYENLAVEGQTVGANELLLRDVSTGRLVLRGRFLDRFAGLTEGGCGALAVTLNDEAHGAMRLAFSRFGPMPDRDAINAVMLDVHDTAMTGDLKRFASHVRFPLTVTFSGLKQHRVVIHDAAQFVRLGNKLFGPNLKRFLAADVPHDPFCRDDECMLAGGFLWFGSDLKIDAFVPG